MARPLRITGAGLVHHIMNRGTARRDIFEDDEERLDFLLDLAEISVRFGVHTLVVVLMDNHYHLVVEDEGNALSNAIGHLNQLHAQRFNGRRGRVGALFQGRFKSRLVQEEVYLAELVRYVHANPVKAGMVARAGDYAWSSHHVYQARQHRSDGQPLPQARLGRPRATVHHRLGANQPSPRTGEQLMTASRRPGVSSAPSTRLLRADRQASRTPGNLTFADVAPDF